MEIIINTLWLFAIAYLLGSFPTAVLISKVFFKSDIRKYGSGNAGSTNMFRNFGVVPGIITQVIDIGKAVAATQIPVLIKAGFLDVEYVFTNHGEDMQLQQFCFGLMAVIGHIFPVFAKFRGGKGVNCLLGTMLIVHPLAAVACIVVFVVVLFLTHYVSAGSLMGTLAFPAYVLVENMFSNDHLNIVWPLIGIFTFFLISFTHRHNIRRLTQGRENKANFFKKKYRRGRA